MTQTTLEAQPTTCATCPYYQSRQDGTDKGWCKLFDAFARETHDVTQDCINTIADEQAAAQKELNEYVKEQAKEATCKQPKFQNQSTISIPQSWTMPKYRLGQRVEGGTIIGLEYHEPDTFISHQYGAGWVYTVLLNPCDDTFKGIHEDNIKLLPSSDLKQELLLAIAQTQAKLAELHSSLNQIACDTESLKPSVLDPNQVFSLLQIEQWLASIACSTEYKKLKYDSDYTLHDAEYAVADLLHHLEAPTSLARI